MGRFLVVLFSSCFACGLLIHFVPEAVGTAFTVRGYAISYVFLFMLAALWMSHKLVAKR